MIMTVEELRQFITTDETDIMLETKLKALELAIRGYTHNNFQDIGFRRTADIVGSFFYVEALTPFEEGDTVQVSQSERNNGLYTVTMTDDSLFEVKERVRDERDVLVTMVTYPDDVKLGAVNILKWQLKNEAAASGDKSAMPIQSETISRHSVTYAQDSTESDIDESFGVPKKLTAFLNPYRKMRC